MPFNAGRLDQSQIKAADGQLEEFGLAWNHLRPPD